MRKICYITTVSMTLNSFVLDSAKYLYENGEYDITFICDNDEEFSKHLPEYIRYIPVNMKRGISLSGISATFKLLKIFKREKFDLVQYSTPNASLYASIAGKMTNVPVRLYCQWGMVYVGFFGLKRQIFKTIEKIVCCLSTWIEPDSYSNMKFAHAEKLYPKEKSSVIWNGSACGVNLKKFDITKKNKYRQLIRKQYNIPENAFVYGFVGRVTRDKGINELLSSFRHICEKNNNIFLIMVGPNDNDSTIDEELFNWSKECERVIYTGYTKVVEQYLSAMNVYLLPSYREGFGMGVIEAQAMGIPVIVTNIPGPTDAMIKDITGLVIEKASISSLREAMLYMHSKPDTIKSFEEEGIKYALSRFEQKTLFDYIRKDREKLLSGYR